MRETIPKYIEEKIKKRCDYQQRANALTTDIEDWCAKNGLTLEYCISHVCLFTEPGMVMKHTISELNSQLEERASE